MKFKKKLFPSIIAVMVVLICFFALPTQVRAAATGTCGENLTWSFDGYYVSLLRVSARRSF